MNTLTSSTPFSNHFLLNGDCAEKMRDLESNSIDAIVTDPPYALTGTSGTGGFMGAKWDSELPTVEMWKEALRIAKPGAHLLAFGGTRTYHRLACAIEDAGWEIRDCCFWCHGQGFPKSMDVAKAIDKASGYEGEVIGSRIVDVGMQGGNMHAGRSSNLQEVSVRAASAAAQPWQGWGTALKPAVEPIVVARKPLEGTVAANVLRYGTGAINIDGCRVPYEPGGSAATNPLVRELHGCKNNHGADKGVSWKITGEEGKVSHANMQGRFPANLIHDGSDEVLALFPESNCGKSGIVKHKTNNRSVYMEYPNETAITSFAHGGSGSAARFFYCAKASRAERNKNCERLLQWEQDQELTQLIEKSSQLLKAISESGMRQLKDAVCNMTSYGSGITDQSQEECKSTISTATRLITALKTLPSSQQSNTSDAILDAIKTSEESGINVAQLAEKLKHLKIVSTSAETDIAINAASALFDVLSEIRGRAKQGNHHYTIKPLALMRYLVRLVTRKGGTVLDPFMGSGTTGVAAIQEGMNFVGIERDPHYYEIASRRIVDAKPLRPTTTQEELPL